MSSTEQRLKNKHISAEWVSNYWSDGCPPGGDISTSLKKRWKSNMQIWFGTAFRSGCDSKFSFLHCINGIPIFWQYSLQMFFFFFFHVSWLPPSLHTHCWISFKLSSPFIFSAHSSLSSLVPRSLRELSERGSKCHDVGIRGGQCQHLRACSLCEISRPIWLFVLIWWR